MLFWSNSISLALNLYYHVIAVIVSLLLLNNLLFAEGLPPDYGNPELGVATRIQVYNHKAYCQHDTVYAFLDIMNSTDNTIGFTVREASFPSISNAWATGFELRSYDGKNVERLAFTITQKYICRPVKPRSQACIGRFLICGPSNSLFGLLAPGEYFLAWKNENVPLDNRNCLPPNSNILQFKIRDDLSSIRIPVNSPVLFGKEILGLKSRLFSHSSLFNIGEPMVFNIEIYNSNVVPKFLFENPTALFESGYFKITSDLNNEIPFLYRQQQYGPSKYRLEPGKTTLIGSADISKYYLLRPGKYSIQFLGPAIPCFGSRSYSSIPPSNIFSFIVRGKLSGVFWYTVLDKLIRNCPDLSTIMYSLPDEIIMQPNYRQGRSKCITIYYCAEDEIIKDMFIISFDKPVFEPWDRANNHTSYIGTAKNAHVFIMLPNNSDSNVKSKIMDWLEK